VNFLFREDDFLRDAEALHLTFGDTLVYSNFPDCDVRRRLDEFVASDDAFAPVLDALCSNVVGRTLFRMVATKSAVHRGGQRIGLHSCDVGNSLYSRKDFAVLTNLEQFDGTGRGIGAHRYYQVDENGEISTKEITLAGVLFHEFCHALHDIENITEITERGELHRSNPILGFTWDNAEELRTITGCIYGVAQDPLCDHCFELGLAIGEGRPFFPRYSHRGHSPDTPPLEEEAELRKLKAHLSESRKIMDGWKRYIR
jgi:hypothetical protein